MHLEPKVCSLFFYLLFITLLTVGFLGLHIRVRPTARPNFDTKCDHCHKKQQQQEKGGPPQRQHPTTTGGFETRLEPLVRVSIFFTLLLIFIFAHSFFYSLTLETADAKRRFHVVVEDKDA